MEELNKEVNGTEEIKATEIPVEDNKDSLLKKLGKWGLRALALGLTFVAGMVTKGLLGGKDDEDEPHEEDQAA